MKDGPFSKTPDTTLVSVYSQNEKRSCERQSPENRHRALVHYHIASLQEIDYPPHQTNSLLPVLIRLLTNDEIRESLTDALIELGGRFRETEAAKEVTG
jgi:hypothetical protein